MVIVEKEDGSNHICVDYQKLNAATKFDAYPMLRIDELLDNIGQSKYLTTLDLGKGYWQVPMAKENKGKQHFQVLQFTTIPFGLSGALAPLQRLMDQVLRGTDTYAGVDLDDIIIYEDTWYQHLKNIRNVFQRLQQAGLTCLLESLKYVSKLKEMQFWCE